MKHRSVTGHFAVLLALLVLLASFVGRASAAEAKLTDPSLTLLEWKIGGVDREAAVYIPPEIPPGGAPLVFVFHGRNNKLTGFVNYFPVHRGWSGAVVVYMQGLVMPWPTGKTADGKAKSGTGWQVEPGGQDDRDLKFFDTVLATLRQKHAIDPKRIYAAGHSNGAAFTYLLWQQRAATFAAFAPVAGGMWAARENPDAALQLAPKPVLQIAGRRDTTVKFEVMEAMAALVKRANACDAAPVPWGDGRCEKFPSARGAPVVTFFHPGGHGVPKEAVGLIVQFFKEHALP
jgi:polyhydroxybutyrate depolymerase